MLDLPRAVAVIAAHPDDDTIGCGGFLSLVAAAGGAVRAIYLSDGSRSHPGSDTFPPARVADLRASEARDALRILGIREEPDFYALRDGDLATLDADLRHETVVRLAAALAAFAPALILAPWRRDPHPDHVAATAIARDAWALLAPRPPFQEYEVWLPVRGELADRPMPGETRLREIALDPSVVERKRRAILAHRTQTSDLIDDAPDGFRIDKELLQTWLGPVERLHA